MVIDLEDINFFYQGMSVPISDDIINAFSLNCKEYAGYRIWCYDHPIDSEDGLIKWKMNVIRSSTPEFFLSKGCSYDIWASAGLDESAELCINVTIILPPRVWQKKVNLCRSEMIGIISHELHHIAQSTVGEFFSHTNDDEDGRLQYFLNDYEIGAFNIGFRAHSSFSGLSFIDLARNYLKNTAPDLKDSDVIRVLETWRNPTFPVFQKTLELTWAS